MSVTADFSEVAALAVQLLGAGEIVEQAADEIVDDEANRIRQEASIRAPRRTGEPAAGFYVRDEGDGESVVANDTRQAFYQEFGTSRHPPQPSLFPASEQADDRIGDRLLLAAELF